MHSLLLMHLGILNEAVTLINVFLLKGGKNALIMGLDKNFWKLYVQVTLHCSLHLAKLNLQCMEYM